MKTPPRALYCTLTEGAPANRATQLGGIKHSAPFIHADSQWAIFRAAVRTTNNMADKRNVLAASFKFSITRSANGRFSVSKAIILHSSY